MKALYLLLKYFGVAILCYLLVQMEVRWYGVAIRHLFPGDEHKWFYMNNASLGLTATRVALVLAVLPLGWLNVLLTYKLFRPLPKAVWLMVFITTFHWILLAVLLGVLNIPGYSPSIIAVLIISMIGAWLAAFGIHKNHHQSI